MVDLSEDRTLVARLWNGSQAPRVPLSVAAAVTFHQTRRNGEARLSHAEYASALDIAAAALSRFIPIYTLDGQGAPVAAAVDLARQRFRGGASELLRSDGTVLAPLDVLRNDLPPALAKMDRMLIEYVAPRRGRPVRAAAPGRRPPPGALRWRPCTRSPCVP
jgi:hypothetical protein